MPEESHANLALINARMGSLHEDIGEIKSVLNRLTDAITKLALIEQQQGQTSLAVERAFKTIERIESRVTAIEVQLPNVTRTSVWMDRMVWAGAAAALMYIAKASGLIGA